mmetsp:Transcript_80335/g.222198  ORF Transcript_80335/g.222198 Transcript_80335/m.222198 type:complete len:107 (+) Transcript_80335:615-935(+)
MPASRLHGMAGSSAPRPMQVRFGLGFVSGLAERALEAAIAFRVRESQRAQRQRLREVREEELVNRKRQRATEVEVRENRKKLRRRLRAEKDLTMEEILRGAPQPVN